MIAFNGAGRGVILVALVLSGMSAAMWGDALPQPVGTGHSVAAQRSSATGTRQRREARRGTRSNAIGNALCGRGPTPDARAVALDGIGITAAVEKSAWAAEAIQTWDQWANSRECDGATPEERARFNERVVALTSIGADLQRGTVVAEVLGQLITLAPIRYDEAEWPRSCAPCNALLASAERMIARGHAAGGKPGMLEPQVGRRLELGKEHDGLRGEFCAMKRSTELATADARARFAYYTWTRTAAVVFDTIEVLQHPSFERLCR
jgi:hypothetical protein